jgi:phosphoribosylanthranilate isomerase
MKLKVCGMKYPDNIRQVARLQPDYMGFIFYTRSKRYVGEDFDLRNLLDLPRSTKTVGIFVNSTKAYVLQKAMKYQLDLVQLHGDESPGFCKELSGSVKLIKAFGLHRDFDLGVLEEYKPYCDLFLFDTKSEGYGGSGKAFDWGLLEKYDNDVPFFLSGGLDLENVKALSKLKKLNLHGIDVNSRFEKAPALKDEKKLKELNKILKR